MKACLIFLVLLLSSCGKSAETRTFSIVGNWEYGSIKYAFKENNQLTSVIVNGQFTMEGTYELSGDSLVVNEVLSPRVHREFTKVDDNTFKNNDDGILMIRN